jgi:type II secretory pathway pseudopilin PulG
MIKAIMKGQNTKAGFTILELAVVIVVIIILLAVVFYSRYIK